MVIVGLLVSDKQRIALQIYISIELWTLVNSVISFISAHSLANRYHEVFLTILHRKPRAVVAGMLDTRGTAGTPKENQPPPDQRGYSHRYW